MQGLGKAERTQRAHEVLELVQLSGYEQRPIQKLSGGQQQRVALARAIAGQPRILLLDEPFSGLDEELRDDMRMLVLDIHKKLQITTLMVTHDAGEALKMSDQIVYMAAGQVVQDTTPQELLRNPRIKTKGQMLTLTIGQTSVDIFEV
jgi:ABC-type Fe3+/spermidine/putrescine transport system ATPase subunit